MHPMLFNRARMLGHFNMLAGRGGQQQQPPIQSPQLQQFSGGMHPQNAWRPDINKQLQYLQRFMNPAMMQQQPQPYNENTFQPWNPNEQPQRQVDHTQLMNLQRYMTA